MALFGGNYSGWLFRLRLLLLVAAGVPLTNGQQVTPQLTFVGEPLTITCTATANATITLMVVDSDGMNMVLADIETTATSRSVNITAASPNIMCSASNGLMDTATDQFYAITIEVADVNAGITATAILFCNVTGAQDANITYLWRQTQNGVFPSDGFPGMIFSGSRVMGVETDTLTITNVGVLAQNYDYTCRVRINGTMVGDGTGTLTSLGPMITEGPLDQTLQARDSLTLNCTGVNNMDATRPLTITWIFIALDNEQTLYTIDSAEVTQMALDNFTLSFFTINNVISGNSGKYGCYVFNREMVEAVSANATVTVFFTPHLTFVADPPMVPRRQRVVLTCTITAQPVANFSEIVRIMDNGKEVMLANEINQAGDRTFRVMYKFDNPVFPDDDGAVFQCRATNANGEAVKDLRIVVQAPPGAINHTNVMAELVSLDSATITWTVPSDNNAPITSYTLMFCVRQSPTDPVCGTSVNVTAPVGQLIPVGDNQLRYTIIELLTEKVYEVVIRAENIVGLQMTPALGRGFFFNTAIPDNGAVANLLFIPSTREVIMTWNLPLLALATTGLNVSFNIEYFDTRFSTNVTSRTVVYDPTLLEQGVSIDLLEANSTAYTVSVTAVYINPSLMSSISTLPNVWTLNIGATLMPEARVSDQIEGDMLTVSWPPPTSTNFLESYSVSYTTSTPVTSARRRRQADNSVRVEPDQTNTTLPFTAFTNYMVGVEAVYAPPGANMVRVSLLPTTTFRTPERQSSPPLEITTAPENILKIRLNWLPPSNPQGIVIAYRIIIDERESVRINGATTHLTEEFDANTPHTFRIAAINGFGDGIYTEIITGRNGFSVVRPVIINTVTGNSQAGTPQFTITADRFSTRYGPLGIYKVVVVRDNRVDPATISDGSLLPQANNPFNYYVASAGNASQQIRSTFVIGDNSVTSDGRNSFTNPPPETGVSYYVFIRLYSSLNTSLFVDSELTQVLQIEDGLLLQIVRTTLEGVPTSVVVGQRSTITCIATVNATITLMVVDSNGMNLTLTDIETTANSRSVNVIATSPGRHNVTCSANNGLTYTTGQFYAITWLLSAPQNNLGAILGPVVSFVIILISLILLATIIIILKIRKLLNTTSAQEINGAGAEGADNFEYEASDLKMPQEPKRLYKEVKQPPVTDLIELK